MGRMGTIFERCRQRRDCGTGYISHRLFDPAGAQSRLCQTLHRWQQELHTSRMGAPPRGRVSGTFRFGFQFAGI